MYTNLVMAFDPTYSSSPLFGRAFRDKDGGWWLKSDGVLDMFFVEHEILIVLEPVVEVHEEDSQ